MRPLGKIILFLVLLVVGLLGLAMTVCGGGFLIALVRAASRGNGGSWLGLAGIAIASIAIGLTALVGVWRGMRVFGERDG